MTFEAVIYQTAVPEAGDVYQRTEWDTYFEAFYWAQKMEERAPFATESEVNEVEE